MIEEKGPWSAAFSNDKAFIESDDFTHDVRLYINGDFESTEQKLEYAEEIAKRLNTFARSTAHDRDKVIAIAEEVKANNDMFGDFSVALYAIAFEDGRSSEREETNRRPLPNNTAPYIRARGDTK